MSTARKTASQAQLQNAQQKTQGIYGIDLQHSPDNPWLTDELAAIRNALALYATMADGVAPHQPSAAARLAGAEDSAAESGNHHQSAA